MGIWRVARGRLNPVLACSHQGPPLARCRCMQGTSSTFSARMLCTLAPPVCQQLPLDTTLCAAPGDKDATGFNACGFGKLDAQWERMYGESTGQDAAAYNMRARSNAAACASCAVQRRPLTNAGGTMAAAQHVRPCPSPARSKPRHRHQHTPRTPTPSVHAQAP